MQSVYEEHIAIAAGTTQAPPLVLLADVAVVLDEELLDDDDVLLADEVLLVEELLEASEPPPAEVALLVEALLVDESADAPPAAGPLVTLPPVLTELVVVGVPVGLPPPPFPALVVLYGPPIPSSDEPWAQLARSTAPMPIKRSVVLRTARILSRAASPFSIFQA
jgi:hypothetical protein